MARFRCIKCGTPAQPFEFESDVGNCPQCNTPSPWELTDVHFVVMGSGPIYGVHGAQHIACDPKRDQLARHAHDNFAASGDPRAVSCRSCMGTAAWREAAQAEAKHDRPWARKLAQMSQGR